jgi:acylphosphatase
MKQIEAKVHGRVQGVFFRDYTRREAQRLGLTGWVKNDWGGTVSTTAVGEEAALQQFVEFLHRGSPRLTGASDVLEGALLGGCDSHDSRMAATQQP